jgi:isoleucyl-tRNA synthetase
VLQQARKSADLDVSDRISVRWSSADAEAIAGLNAHAETIADEVLATAFARDDALPPEAASADLNGTAVRYTLAKA